MKTQQEIEAMKYALSDEITRLQGRLNDVRDEFSYNIVNHKIKALMAQYNILLEVLK